jgi:hypothetical protein
MAIYTVRTVKGGRTLLRKQVSEGQGRDAVVLQAQAEASYVFSDALTNTGPAKIHAKRVGQNLHLALNKGNPDTPDVIIEGYFDFPLAPIAGALAEGGQAVYDLGALSAPSSETASASSVPTVAKATSAQASLPGNDWGNLGWIGAGLLGLAAAGGGKSGGDSPIDPATTAQSKVSAYAADGTQPAPTVDDYASVGVKGVTSANLAAVNSAVDTLQAVNVENKTKIQIVVDAYSKILAEANGVAADTTPGSNPLVSDYEAIGASIGLVSSNAAALSLLNEVVGNLTTSAVDSIAEINAIAVVIGKVMIAAAGSPATLTIADYALLGLTTSGAGAVTATNLAAVNNALTSSGGQTKVDTYTELNALVTAVATIVSYAEDTSQALPTLVQYNAAGLSGVTASNLDAINSAVDANAVSGVDTKAELQAIVDTYNLILAEANGAAADATPNVNPTAAQYALIGANIGLVATNAAALGLLNDVISDLSTTAIDSIAEINALAAIVNKVMATAAGNPSPLTLAEFALLGLSSAGSGAVTATNLAAINSAMASVGGPSRLDSKTKIQTVVDAYNKILAEANGVAADATPGSNPLASDYEAIGASIGLASSNAAALSLLNEVVGNLTSSAVDSIAEINALAAVVDKIMVSAAGTPAALTIADYALLGLPTSGSGAVTAVNLAAVNNAIASAGGQAKVDTYVELNALVTAVATIVSYADDHSQALPTLAQYSAAGISGVTASNLDAINSAVDANAASGVDTKAELQAIIDTYNLILAEANGSAADATPGVNPTAAQYALIGADIGLAATNAAALGLLNEVVGNLTSTAVDSIAEINALAAVVGKVMTAASGSPAPLSLADCALLGLGTTGAGAVTAVNLAAVNNALTTTGGPAKVDTFAELSALVTAVATIVSYADDNTQAAPTLAQYSAAGITGLTASNLGAINSAVDANAASGVDTKAELQSIVDTYNLILAEANGSAADTTPGFNPTAAQYALIGTTIGAAATNAVNLSLLDDSLAGLASTAVDTVAEINDLAAAANALIAGAAGATAPSLAQLATLGIAGVTINNLLAVQNAIAATADSGLQVDTMAELQAVVTGAVNAAASSQNRIQNYATSSANPAPSLLDYGSIGVSGVDGGNLAAINSAVDALSSSGVDTPFHVQGVVDAYSSILAEANGAAADASPGVNPSANDYAAIGASIGLASGGIATGGDLASSALALLDNAVADLTTTQVDSVAEITALASVVDKVMNLAKLATGSAIPAGTLSMSDLTLLGVNTTLADTPAEVNVVLQSIIDSVDSGSGVNTILALQAIVNAHVS